MENLKITLVRIFIPELIELFKFLIILFTGRKIAIDASMCLYQFLIAVRIEG